MPHTCFDHVVYSLYPQPPNRNWHSCSIVCKTLPLDNSLCSIYDNGTICVENTLDYEKQSYHECQIMVSLSEYPSISSFIPIGITVMDVNEMPIMLTTDVYLYDNVEYSSWSSNLQYSDPDPGQTVHFSIVDTVIYPFVLSSDGQLILDASLEEMGNHQVTINVSLCDDGTPQLCNIQPLTIHIIHAESIPACYDYEYHINEHLDIGEELLPAYYVESNSDLVYSMINSTKLSIHPHTGVLIIREDIDYESTPNHQLSLTLRTSLMSNTTLFCDSQITITVHDIPEKPEFNTTINWSGSVDPNEIVVSEMLPIGSAIGNPLLFSDPDIDDCHAFTIECLYTTICPFAIDAAGQIYLNNTDRFDYEVTNKWIVKIRVTDGSNLFDETIKQITLFNVNEPPQFQTDIAYRTGFYPCSVGDQIGLPIQAVDPENDTLLYSLDDSSFFYVDNNGQIYLKKDTINPYAEYQLLLTAMDSEGLEASIIVIISFNINAAPFTVAPHSYSIPEDSEIGTTLQPAISVTGLYRLPLHYEMQGSNLPFTINNSSGLIMLTGTVDYELQNTFTFQILVTDAFLYQVNTTVAVFITDVNEPPHFNYSTCSVARNVFQNATDNTFIPPIVEAWDPDVSDSLVFSVSSLDGSTLPFAIHPSYGLLYVNNSILLRESNYIRYSFLVIVSDMGGLTDSCMISISVIPEELPLTFSWIPSNVTISEASEIGTKLHIPYYIQNPQENSYFMVEDKTTGIHLNYSFPFVLQEDYLILSQPLDYETQNEYIIHFCVYSIHGHHDCRNVTIHVIDVNEPPYITYLQSPILTPENTPVQSLITNIKAEDPENSAIHYHLVGNLPFSIHPSTGAIFLSDPLDYEQQSEYNVTVIVSDSEGLSTFATLIIQVENVNEPPICLLPSKYVVSEDLSIHSIIGRIAVEDEEVKHGTQTLYYSLLTPQVPFTVSSDGLIIAMKNLKNTTQAVYSISTLVEDSGSPSLSCICNTTISIMKRNSPPTLSLESTILTIAEDTAIHSLIPLTIQIGNVNETQFITFFIQDNPTFGIHPMTGNLYIKKPLDYETQSVYNVTIGIQDLTNPSLHSDTNLTILVTDVNEPPILPHQSFSIAENAPVNTSIGTIQFMDVDEGVNGTVSCLQLNLENTFHVNPSTCEVTLTSTLDYESNNVYSLHVVLQDAGGLETDGFVTILVTDVNEPPIIHLPQEHITILSDTPLYSIVLSSIEVNDPDGNLDSVFLESSSPLPFHLIHSQVMYTIISNATIDKSNYEFNLTAMDTEGLQDLASISITVLPSSIPIPDYDPIICSVPEHTPLYTILEDCIIQISNAETFSSIAYLQQFSLASTAFSILPMNATAAQVMVNEDVDFEVNEYFIIPFAITAEDIVSKQLQTIQAIVTIHVLDVNEPPYFTESPSLIRVQENTPSNTLLVPCLRAKDPDDDDIHFSISSNDWFGIEESTGCLFVKQAGLDFENSSQPNEFELTVSVSDSEFTTSTSVTIQIENVNEPPAFASPSYTAVIALPVSSNSLIPLPIEVSDPDSSLTFSILHQSCPDAFEVSLSSPTITTSSQIVPELSSSQQNRSCTVLLQAMDSEGLSDSTLITIHLLPDIVPPTIQSSTFSIGENPSTGDLIGTLVAESHCNKNSSLVYDLQPSPYSSAVSIDHQTGSLSVSSPTLFDYESIQSIPLFIMVTDVGCQNVTATKEIKIDILDVNEPPIVQNRTYHITSGSHYPLTLTPSVNGIDPEGSPVVYFFLSPHVNVSIDLWGVLKVHGDLTASLPEPPVNQPTLFTYSFNYSLLATDVGSPPLSTQFTITILVDKLLAGNPSQSHSLSFVAGPSITLFVSEDIEVGTTVGDPFAVETNEESPILFFSIASSVPSSHFQVHSVTGQLSTVSTLDFESIPNYSLNITVTNGFTTASIQVFIKVEDISDCVIHSISPSLMPFNSTWITFTGSSLSPLPMDLESSPNGTLITGQSFSTSFLSQYVLLDQYDNVTQEGNTTQCFIQSSKAVTCELSATIANHIHWSFSWQSSIERAVPHLCSINTPIIPYEPIHVQQVIGATSIPTTGSTVCFVIDPLYVNATTATVRLYDSTERTLTSCVEKEEMICCTVDKGYGTSLTWNLCVYGLCDSVQHGSYTPPTITSVVSSSSLNCLGGDKVILTGTNFGGDLSALTVYVYDGESQKPLSQCYYLSLHSQVECTMIPGLGSNLIFAIEVGDQLSTLYHSSLSYDLPKIINIYGVGSSQAHTEGGQEVYVSGENLGMEDFQIRLYYGNTTMSYQCPCHVLIPHSLLRCITAEGSGYQNQWQLMVGNQLSNIYSQEEGIYGYPAVTEVQSASHLPAEGGMNVTIFGLNFGHDSNLLHVQYQNEYGVTYYPHCNLLNHTHIQCISVPGFGSNVSWGIDVNGLYSPDLFTLSYSPPIITSLSCKSTCGRVTGNDVVIIHGNYFAPSTSYVTATYGFSGNEFIAKHCTITSVTTIECTTVPGVGQNLQWIILINEKHVACPSSMTYSYEETIISYPSQIPLPLEGGSEIMIHSSNDFTMCSCCSFSIVMGSTSIDAGVLNATTLFGYSSSILTHSIQAHVLVSCLSTVAEITNTISIPLNNPSIQSFMIDPTVQANSMVYILSLFGSDFGFTTFDFYVYLNVLTSTGQQKVPCNVLSVSNEYVSCMTSYSEGTLYVSRSGALSNTISYYLNEVSFSVTGFETTIEGYYIYPQSFRTAGGEILRIHGSRIPTTVTVSVGNSQCPVVFINATQIECLVPEGEGRGVPVHIHHEYQILFRFFINYKAPLISVVSPSILQFDSVHLLLEGDNFGLTPTILLSGIEMNTIQTSLISSSHTVLNCTLSAVDTIGMILQVEVAHQFSNTLVLPVMSPSITSISIQTNQGEELEGVPTEGNCIAHIQGANLNAPNTQCILNGIALPIVYKTASDVFCSVNEVYESKAIFSLQMGLLSTNNMEVPLLPPLIHKLNPQKGSTIGNELITIEGEHFGCSSQQQSIQLSFNGRIIPILHCNHTYIQFLSPAGQGVAFPVNISRADVVTHTTFSYYPPFIQSVQSVLQTTEYLVVIDGQNFGVHLDSVFIGDEQCAVLQQNHTHILCWIPLLFGGNHSVIVEVGQQRSNIVIHSFALPFIEVVSPLLVESMNATLSLSGSYIPLLSGISIEIQIGSILSTNCHLTLNATNPLPFIECHLPELPRGEWPLSLSMNNHSIDIATEYSIITVICPLNYYAESTQFCKLCPKDTFCPLNATSPTASPGEWIIQSSKDTYENVVCFNPNACAGANQCNEGYQSIQCSQCTPGYTRYRTWICMQCPKGIGRYFNLLWLLVVCSLIYLSSVCRFSSYSIWFTIMIDTLQMIGLLSLIPSNVLPILSSTIDFGGYFLLNMELFHLDCLFPSWKETHIWLIVIFAILACILVDLLLCALLKRKFLIYSSRGGLARVSSLLNSFLLPILYHSLQSLSCNNGYYMAQYSIRFTDRLMCWKQHDYHWILFVSAIALVSSTWMMWYSFARTRSESESSSQETEAPSPNAHTLVNNNLSQNVILLGWVYSCNSIKLFYQAGVFKYLVAIVMIVIRNEDYLQSILLLLLVLPTLPYFFNKTIYTIQHIYYKRNLSRIVLTPLLTNQNVPESSILFQAILSDKKWMWDVNTLSAFGLIIFIFTYIDCMTKPTSISFLKTVVDCTIALLFYLHLTCLATSGISEWISFILGKPIAFFDHIQIFDSFTDESVVVSSELHTDLKEESRKQMKAYINSNVRVPPIPKDSSTSEANTLLHVSLGELLRNQRSTTSEQNKNEHSQSGPQEQDSSEMNELSTLFEKKLKS